MNHSVTTDSLFCVDRISCPVLRTTVSQQTFCFVLTEFLVLCKEPQCHNRLSVLCWQKSLSCVTNHSHKRFSVLCWQKSLSCVMNHSVTTDFLFCVDRSPCPVLRTTVSQQTFCFVLTEVLVLCYEPQCHKRFSVLWGQKSLFCVMNHSVTSLFILRSALNIWPPIYFFGAENK